MYFRYLQGGSFIRTLLPQVAKSSTLWTNPTLIYGLTLDL